MKPVSFFFLCFLVRKWSTSLQRLKKGHQNTSTKLSLNRLFQWDHSTPEQKTNILPTLSKTETSQISEKQKGCNFSSEKARFYTLAWTNWDDGTVLFASLHLSDRSVKAIWYRWIGAQPTSRWRIRFRDFVLIDFGDYSNWVFLDQEKKR